MNRIHDKNLDILGVSEVDIEDLDEKKPFTIKGFKTYFPLQRIGSNKRRLLCFVEDSLEAKQRNVRSAI